MGLEAEVAIIYYKEFLMLLGISFKDNTYLLTPRL
jgi:hypothetical protein